MKWMASIPWSRMVTVTLWVGLVLAGPVVAQEDPFEPVQFEREWTLRIDGAPDEVFPLFTPEGMSLWRGEWDPEYLFSASEMSKAGTMFRDPHGHGPDWWVVGENDPRKRMIRYVYLMPGVELLVEEIRCREGLHGGTVATVQWRVVGLTERGNELVENFFVNYAEDFMEPRQRAINAYLRSGRNRG